ncbi:MAG: TonB family protein [Chthoniobacterales bacterium]
MNMHLAFICLALALLASGCAGGKSTGSGADASAYSHRMHSRFYQAWVQPATVTAHRKKISVPVDVQIDSRGRVLAFEIEKSSGDQAVDASIAAVGQRIKKVAAPPGRTNFRLRIFFELDVR